MSDINKIILGRTRALIKEHGWSISHFCRQFGRSVSWLTDFERKDIAIDDNILLSWADTLHTTVDYLTGKTDEKKSAAIEGDGRRQKFISLFEKLTPEMQDAIISLLESSQSKE